MIKVVWYYELVAQIMCTHVQIDQFLWYTIQQNILGSEISKFFKKTEFVRGTVDIKYLSFTKKTSVKEQREFCVDQKF